MGSEFYGETNTNEHRIDVFEFVGWIKAIINFYPERRWKIYSASLGIIIKNLN